MINLELKSGNQIELLFNVLDEQENLLYFDPVILDKYPS